MIYLFIFCSFTSKAAAVAAARHLNVYVQWNKSNRSSGNRETRRQHKQFVWKNSDPKECGFHWQLANATKLRHPHG